MEELRNRGLRTIKQSELQPSFSLPEAQKADV